MQILKRYSLLTWITGNSQQITLKLHPNIPTGCVQHWTTTCLTQTRKHIHTRHCRHAHAHLYINRCNYCQYISVRSSQSALIDPSLCKIYQSPFLNFQSCLFTQLYLGRQKLSKIQRNHVLIFDISNNNEIKDDLCGTLYIELIK